MREAFALPVSQTPALLREAMQRPVHRLRYRERLLRLEIVGEFASSAKHGGEGSPRESHNNYLAQSSERRAKPRHTGKVGAPFGNRNAAKPESAGFRAFKAKADAFIARVNAAMAAAEAIIAARQAARPPRRRITCITYVENGAVRRVAARVQIRVRAKAALHPAYSLFAIRPPR